MSLQTRIPVLYGAGFLGANPASLEECQVLIDEWCKRVGPSVIDSSNIYANGESQRFLGKLNLHGSRVDTKMWPLFPGHHSAEKLKETVNEAVAALGNQKIRVLYLHAPDRTVPYAETLKAIDDLYREGKFEIFGLSNYRTYEVGEIVTLCRANGWIVPTVYQAIYNAIDRSIETEMIPCLRRYGIKLAAYSPLAGGFLVGHLLPSSTADAAKGIVNPEQSGHFDPKFALSGAYHGRYGAVVAPICELRDVTERHGISLYEASIRWIQHHSAIKPSDWGIIYGGSKVSHIEKGLAYNAAGPLPQEVVDAFEKCHAQTKGSMPNYHADAFWYDVEKHGY